MLRLIDAIPQDTDRRIKNRFQPAFGATCQYKNSTGLIWDISPEGLGLLLPFAPPLGETTSITLETETNPEVLSVRIEVAHVRSLSSGDYFVGARFERMLTGAEIEPFISPILGRPSLTISAGHPTPPPKMTSRMGKRSAPVNAQQS